MGYKSGSPIKDAGGFEDEDFSGYCGNSEQNNEMSKEQMGIAMERRVEIIDTSGEDTIAWVEAQVRYGQLEEDFEIQIGLSIGFGGLGGSRRIGLELENGMGVAKSWIEEE